MIAGKIARSLTRSAASYRDGSDWVHPGTPPRRSTLRTRRSFPRRDLRRAPGQRAVSTIIATILLLLLTVSLFAVVFFAVQLFPKPATPDVSQFSVALSFKPGTSLITSISISHLSGPTVSGATASEVAIYLASQNRSTTYGPFNLSQGLGAGTTAWAFGQTWRCTTACVGFPTLFAPDNLTISVTSHSSLLFRDSLQAIYAGFAPYFTQASVVPTTGSVFQSSTPTHYTVSVSIACSAACRTSNPVTLNYSQFVGIAKPAVAMTCTPVGAALENCTYTSSGSNYSPAASGTYFLFLVATDSLGRSDTYTLTVTVH